MPMCTALSELEQAISTFAAGFEPGTLPPGELATALRSAGRIEKVAATLAALVAARIAGTGPAQVAGRQAERDLAAASGTSVGEAHRAIEAAKDMAQLPELRAAAVAGGLSRQQASLVCEAAALDPDCAPELVAKAARLGLAELQEECARAKAAHLDMEGRRRAAHAVRALRSYTDAGGVWHMHAQGRPEDGAKIIAAVNQLSTAAFQAARTAGRRERPEAYAFDGLVALAEGCGNSPAAGSKADKAGSRTARLRPSFMVRADLGAVLRGYPVQGEVCEIAGFGPISTQAAIDLLDCEDPFLKAIVTDGQKVTGVAHLGRRPNAYQRSALDWLFPTCAADGCSTRAEFLQSDHREDWARTHFTAFDLLDRLCRLHHAQKTLHGWALVAGRGKRAFVPPDDPRHPRFARQ
jgi:hypothetical protein